MSLKEFLRPTSVGEAVKQLSGSAARQPLAGGTFLGLHAPVKTRGLVDLSHVGLRYITGKSDQLVLGAMTTFADIANEARTGALGGVLAGTATEPLRHMITVGGNLMIPLRWSDLPVLLTVLDAEVVLRQKGTRRITIDTLYAQSPKAALRQGEIVKEVRLPRMKGVRLSRRKLLRMHDDVPALHVAVALHLPRTRMHGVRIAFVAQKSLPTRLLTAERVLEGASPASDIITAAAEAAMAECGTLSDSRYSSEYLREMLGVFVTSCVQRCTGVAGEDQADD